MWAFLSELRVVFACAPQSANVPVALLSIRGFRLLLESPVMDANAAPAGLAVTLLSTLSSVFDLGEGQGPDELLSLPAWARKAIAAAASNTVAAGTEFFYASSKAQLMALTTLSAQLQQGRIRESGKVLFREFADKVRTNATLLGTVAIADGCVHANASAEY